MASDNLMAMAEQPQWFNRTAFSDAWISDLFAVESDALTRALQKSLGSDNCSNDDVFSTEMMEAFFAKPEIAPIQTPTVSGVSEIESPVLKRQRSLQPSGKVTKRKSRASKRETTTFITVDVENFRQTVQQVTGAKFDGFSGRIAMAPVINPEPHKAAAFHRLQPCSDLATFDASDLVLEGSSPLVTQFAPAVVSDGAAAFDMEPFCSFPTLESSEVM